MFHDSVITTHHWTRPSLKFENVAQVNELLELLYNVPPLYHLNPQEWDKHVGRIARHHRFFGPLHRRSGVSQAKSSSGSRAVWRQWMEQVARNLSCDMDGFLAGKRYLIHDWDSLFTPEFVGTLAAAGVKSVKLPARSPNLNAYAERFVRTIKESCLDRLILFGEGSLRKAIREFVVHYHCERNHQGMGNRLILAGERLVGLGGERCGVGSGWAGC